MAGVKIAYSGTLIAEMDAQGIKTLHTSGKYCKGNIQVAYDPPSGGGATIATGSFKPGLSNPNYTVTHGLGVTPNFAICYRSMETLITAKKNTFVYLAKLNGVGTMVASHDGSTVRELDKNGNAGQDTAHAITDIPTEYAPYVGAYGATENKITFGFNYDSSRGDTYFCFDAGWDTFYWIVGVM